MRVIACLFVLALVSGCHQKKASDLTPDDVPGVYWGFYRGGKETIRIFPDGRFSQQFTNEMGVQLYSNSGTWEIINPGRISFSPWIGFHGSLSNKFETYSSGACTLGVDPARIEIGENDYYVLKDAVK